MIQLVPNSYREAASADARGGPDKLVTLRNPSLIRLAATRARVIGDLPESLLETTKAIGKLEHAQHARKSKH